jgi:serine phosphatase RsbU (regulator of sigma subunit)
VALRADCRVNDVVDAANAELARENREMLFVTLLAGILDVQTGALELCNAGHDAPYLVGVDGSVRQLESEHGPPLCVLDNFSFPLQQLQLAPGDRLCVITDGINEAMNAGGELFGGARLVSALQSAGAGPQALLESTREAVRAFVGAAAPSDDLTLLTLQWHGPQA